MAEAQRKNDPDNRRDPITRFKMEYAEALDEARVSSKHTDTEGWQHLYQGFHKVNRENRRKAAGRLKQIGEELEVAEIGEHGEKDLVDVKKQVQAFREEREIFERKTVGPVREPVEKCQKIIGEARQQAEVDEERAPMVNIGLCEMLLLEIRKLERAVWDADTGRVEIKSPE